MYREFFGLDYPPYRITPDTQLFYPGGERGAILDALVYTILNGDAITKVVGEVGSGKTMLCRMLELKLPDSVEIVYLANPNLTPENTLHAIAFELGLPEADNPDRLQVMKKLQAYLLQKHAEGRQVVVFVEEAQGMPLETLEEIRLLSNLETRQHKLLQIILFGQPELDAGLSATHVRQIKDRITNSFYLKPLRAKDIGDYLIYRLESAGYRGPNIYRPGALRLIARASQGLMRRINILADKAMLAAYTENTRIVTTRHVRAAMRDCEFITRRVWLGPALISAFCVGAASMTVAWAMMNVEPDQKAAPAVAAEQINQPPIAPRPTPVQSARSMMPSKPTVIPSVEQKPTQLAAPDTVPSEQQNLVENRLKTTRDWLAQANPRHFTIQVLLSTADELKALERFLRRQDARGELDATYVHPINVRGSERFSVLYGDYSDYQEAETALRMLPDEVQRFQPYLRNIRQILAESVFTAGQNREKT